MSGTISAVFYFEALGVSRLLAGGWQSYPPSTVVFLQHGTLLAKLMDWGPTSKALLLSKRQRGLPGKQPLRTHQAGFWYSPVLQTARSTSLSLSLSWLVSVHLLPWGLSFQGLHEVPAIPEAVAVTVCSPIPALFLSHLFSFPSSPS